MIRVCCYCKVIMGEKEPLDDKSQTHGICDDCGIKVREENKARKARERAEREG